MCIHLKLISPIEADIKVYVMIIDGFNAAEPLEQL